MTSQELGNAMQEPRIDPEYKSLLPPYQPGEYEALKQSIKEDGQLEPIVISKDGRILDGHTRLQICQELCVAPRFEVKDFRNRLEERKFVITVNLRRRQLANLSNGSGQRQERFLLLFPLRQDIKSQNYEGMPQISGSLGSTPTILFQ